MRYQIATMMAVALGVGICDVAVAAPDAYVSGAVGGHWRAAEEVLPGVLLATRLSGEYDFDNGFGVQGDLLVDWETTDFDDGMTYENTRINLAMHAFYRDPARYLFGAFVQHRWDDTDYVLEGEVVGELAQSADYVGLEAQAFADRLTVYGQIGAAWATYEYLDTAGWFATAELRYFVTDDLVLKANAGLQDLSLVDGDDSTTTYQFGLGAEYRLPDLPVSLFASLQAYESNFEDSFSRTDTRVLVGLKFNLGTETLFERDRTGASLNPVPDFPVLLPVR